MLKPAILHSFSARETLKQNLHKKLQPRYIKADSARVFALVLRGGTVDIDIQLGLLLRFLLYTLSISVFTWYLLEKYGTSTYSCYIN